MKILLSVCLLACAIASAQEAPIPREDEIGGRPFAIKDKWIIGGAGNWDYLNIDPVARQLFIAHGASVQVVDAETGALAGVIDGLGEARAIVLDESGTYGYISDSGKNRVHVFDRRTFRLEASIPTGPSPRTMALDKADNLLFTMSGGAAAPVPNNADTYPRRIMRPAAVPNTKSFITVIDIEKRVPLGQLLIAGRGGSLYADDGGHLYVTVTDRSELVVFDARATADALRKELKEERTEQKSKKAKAAEGDTGRGTSETFPTTSLDFSDNDFPLDFQRHNLSPSCREPMGITGDDRNNRLFIACDNMKMAVVDSNRGNVMTSLTIGPGADSICYDPNRNLIFTANGSGYGSVSIIRQHTTDSYGVIQNLPTMQHARTMAVDPSSGTVYVVTTLYGADLRHAPTNGIGTLRLNPVDGSFQVLVIGN